MKQTPKETLLRLAVAVGAFYRITQKNMENLLVEFGTPKTSHEDDWPLYAPTGVIFS